MQPKFTLWLGLLSVLAAIGFAGQWLHHQNRVHELKLATGSQEGEYYAFAKALAEVVERHHPKIKITVEATAGADENLDRLERNQSQLAIVQSDTPSRSTVRAVAYLFPEVAHLIVRPNSGIRTVHDLRGKRIALMPQGSGSYSMFWLLSQHYNLRENDFTATPMPPQNAYNALQQGQVDALFRVMALSNPSMRQLLQTTQAQIVAIDQVDSLQLSLPYLEAATIPKGAYDGGSPIPPADLPVVGVRAVLIGRENVNPWPASSIRS